MTENKQEQKFRVVIDNKVISENFDSIQDAMEWTKTNDITLTVREGANLVIETYLKPKLLLD